MADKKNMLLALAFDIERVNNEVIAFGAVLTDSKRNVLNAVKFCGFDKNRTAGADYHEFWKVSPDRLALLEPFEYKGDAVSFQQIQRELVETFQTFRIEAEAYAAANHKRLLLVVDSVTDVTFMSSLITRYINEEQYIPKLATPVITSGSTTPYYPFDNQSLVITSVLESAIQLACGDPNAFQTFNSDEYAEKHGLPLITVEHDHDPIHDAQYIAENFWRLAEALMPPHEGKW